MTTKLTSTWTGGRGGGVCLFFSVILINALTFLLLESGSPGKNVGHLASDILFTFLTSTYLYYNICKFIGGRNQVLALMTNRTFVTKQGDQLRLSEKCTVTHSNLLCYLEESGSVGDFVHFSNRKPGTVGYLTEQGHKCDHQAAITLQCKQPSWPRCGALLLGGNSQLVLHNGMAIQSTVCFPQMTDSLLTHLHQSFDHDFDGHKLCKGACSCHN